MPLDSATPSTKNKPRRPSLWSTVAGLAEDSSRLFGNAGLLYLGYFWFIRPLRAQPITMHFDYNKAIFVALSIEAFTRVFLCGITKMQPVTLGTKDSIMDYLGRAAACLGLMALYHYLWKP